jgi:2-polyprenyl-6-methoxyphenol hydroxylase-like FAD-dependent oxidoreductase
MRRIGERVVVLGAGIGGLLAARVLSEAYERVVVVERDPLAPATTYRRGVPQGRHAHLLIPSGSRIFNDLFPGLDEDLATEGVPLIRDFAEFSLAPRGGAPLLLRGPTGDPFLCQASRPFLEKYVRARVGAVPAVEVIDRCDAVAIRTDPAGHRVTGVRVRHRDGDGAEETIRADLVVDATGRGSRAPAWLAALGYDEPPQEQLAINLLYVTRHLRLRPGALSTKVVGVGAEPDRPAGFVLFAQEGDRWILTVFGYGDYQPPRDAVALVHAVERMAPPDVVAAIRDAEPVGDIVVHRFPANVWRRFDRLRRFPAGYLVFGDAICSTNPAYALGMSVSALQAVALRDALARGETDLARRFFRAAAKPIGRAWQAVLGGDLALPVVPGPRPLAVRPIGGYAARATRAAARDAVLAKRLLRVASLEDPPTRLFRPGAVVRILRSGARPAGSPADAPGARRALGAGRR